MRDRTHGISTFFAHTFVESAIRAMHRQGE